MAEKVGTTTIKSFLNSKSNEENLKGMSTQRN